MILAVSPWYALALAALFFVLSARVILYRRGNRISLGTANDPAMEYRVRAQGNFAEYAPLGLVLLVIAEINGAGAFWLHLCGILLLTGRLIHGVNFSFRLGSMALRVGGMMLTFAALALAAVLAVAGTV